MIGRFINADTTDILTVNPIKIQDPLSVMLSLSVLRLEYLLLFKAKGEHVDSRDMKSFIEKLNDDWCAPIK